jgi:hypothetical protein
VFCCVGNDGDLRQVALGETSAFQAPEAGRVDNTTASATIARELHAAGKARGCDFFDAPVSGGQAGAEQGVLTVASRRRCRPLRCAKRDCQLRPHDDAEPIGSLKWSIKSVLPAWSKVYRRGSISPSGPASTWAR